MAAEGHQIIGAGRAGPGNFDRNLFENFVNFDLGEKPDITEHLMSADAVVHLAARVHVFEKTKDEALAMHRLINAEGTRRLAEQAAQTGVKKFIFVSSISVNGPSSDSVPFTETSTPNPAGPYGISKLEAENAVREVCARSDMKYAILRPPLVYGPGATANMHRLVKATYMRFPFPLFGVKTRRSFIYIDNLSDVIAFCLDKQTRSDTFLVSDGEPVLTTAMIKMIGKYMGRQARFFWMPQVLLKAAANAVGKGEELRRFVQNCEVDSSKIFSLGWRPVATMDMGIRKTVEHFLAQEAKRKASPELLTSAEALQVKTKHVQ